MGKKPKGFRAFGALVKQLAGVPKEDVDKKVAADKAKRIAKRKKK